MVLDSPLYLRERARVRGKAGFIGPVSPSSGLWPPSPLGPLGPRGEGLSGRLILIRKAKATKLSNSQVAFVDRKFFQYSRNRITLWMRS
jgi:hypothetical protein